YRPSLALGSADFTVSTWVKYTAGSADQVIFWGYGTGATERSVWLRAQPSKDRLYGYVQTDTGAYEFSGVDTSAAVAFGDGAWHHVALRRAGGSLGLFVDGNQVGSGSVSGSLTYGDTFAVDGFTLGMKPDGTDRFKGAMDLFEIHRRALTDSELREVDGDFGSVTAVRLGLDSAS
ncbi:LamG domain-containing protein, partial [Kibdelosporangium lantanae]